VCNNLKWRRKTWQQFYGRSTNCAITFGFFTIFVNYFVHIVSATVSYGRKELLDIRTAITHLELDKDYFHNKQDMIFSKQPAGPESQFFARGSDAGTEDEDGCLARTHRRRVAAVTVNMTRQRTIIEQ
jgi:hypothetical protein